MIKPFGYSLILDLFNCNPEYCSDLNYNYCFLEELVDFLGMKKQSPPFIFKTDEKRYAEKAGLSGWIPLIESGIQIHTLTKKNFISIDVYSCGIFNAEEVVRFAKERYNPQKIEKHFFSRGRDYYK